MFALLAIVCAAPLPFLQNDLRAQEIQRIAAIVNDQIISGNDLNERIQLALASTGLADSAETRRRLRDQVLRGLITETLQVQEASRLRLSITTDEINRVLAKVEQDNNVPSGRFEEFLRAQGISVRAISAQVRAELAWSKVIRRNLQRLPEISDEEVDATLQRQLLTKNVPESLVSEIFLSVDSPTQDEEVRRTAQRLAEQARQEKNFAAIARQFSQGTTAAQGGDLGWITTGILPEEVDAVIAKLGQGEISDPIRTSGGYYIVGLRNRRTQGETLNEPTIALRQIMLPLAADADQASAQGVWDQATKLSSTVRGCDQFQKTAEDVKSPIRFDVGRGPISALAPEIRQIVSSLAVGQISAPLRQERGVFLLMICDMQDANAASRDAIRQQLQQRRIELTSRRLLRDLRRDAVVELR